MCDTIAVVGEGRVLFAKNSDRDVNEAQFLQWHPASEHPQDSRLKCTWIEIPQVRRTHAVLISRPFWIWGAEMGANEHGVAIGNEAVFTKKRVSRTGLTGMDLLRLALERAETAKQAVEVIKDLIRIHGQGGGCGHESKRFTYHNSFIIADPRGAYVLETADRECAVEPVRGARSISNGLSIPGFARKHSDYLYTRVSECRRRRQVTQSLAEKAARPADLMAVLRSHEAGREYPRYRWLNGAMASVCMHAGGIATGSQTTASWVAELSPQGNRHWVTGTSTPCAGLFKPVRVEEPLDLGPEPVDRYDPSTLWWRHEVLARPIARNPERLLPLVAAERDDLESSWLANPPEPAQAFAEADRRLQRWTEAVRAVSTEDVRPWIVRRYWKVRNRRAGMPLPWDGKADRRS